MWHKPRGFTLIGMMIILIILVLLAAIVLPKLIGGTEYTKKTKAKQTILTLQSALDFYKLDNGFYPTTEQGLQALVSKPTAPPVPEHWKEGGYITMVPKDPWGNSYHYVNDHEKIQLFTYGRGNEMINNNLTPD